MANMQDIAPVTLSQPRVVVNHLRKPLVWPWRKCTYRGVRVPVKPVASEDEAPAGGKNENARIEVATEGVDDGSSDASDTTTVVGSNNGEDSGEDPHQDTEDEQDDDGNSGAGESGEDDNNEDGEEENDGGNSIDEEDDDDKTIIEEDTNSLETEEDTSGTESEEDGPVHEAAPILAFLPCTVTREPAPYRIRRVLERIPGDIWADLEYYLGDEIDSDEEEEDDTGSVDSDGYAADDDVGDDLNYQDESGSDSDDDSNGDLDESDGEADTQSDIPKPPAGAGTPMTSPLNKIARFYIAWQQRRNQGDLLDAVVQRLKVLQRQTTAGSDGQPGEPDSGISPVVGSGLTQQTTDTTEAVPPTPARHAPEHAQHGDAEPSANRTDEEPSPGARTRRKRDTDADLLPSKRRRL